MRAPLRQNVHAQSCERRPASKQKQNSVATATDPDAAHLVSSAGPLLVQIHDASPLFRSCPIGESVVPKGVQLVHEPRTAVPAAANTIAERTGSRPSRHEACLADDQSRRGAHGWRNWTPILINIRLSFTSQRQPQDVAKATKITAHQPRGRACTNGLIRY